VIVPVTWTCSVSACTEQTCHLPLLTRRDFRLLKHLQLFQVRRFELHNKAADIRYKSHTQGRISPPSLSYLHKHQSTVRCLSYVYKMLQDAASILVCMTALPVRRKKSQTHSHTINFHLLYFFLHFPYSSVAVTIVSEAG
jgi:hypothetical protein